MTRRRGAISDEPRRGDERRGWRVTDVEPSHFKAPKPVEVMFKPDEQWYRLRQG